MNHNLVSDCKVLKGYDVAAIGKHEQMKLFVGIDIGSTSSDIVVLDDKDQVLFSDYQRTKGRPIETAYKQLKDMLSIFNCHQISVTAATGSAGRLMAEILEIPFVNEVSAQAKAIRRLYPDFGQATIIEMGGQDSKLIFLSEQKDGALLRDFALNTVCAAGTGSFLDQQAARLGVDIENEFGAMALESKVVPRMAGRCSVFAKSDMIHLQQQATPTCDIVAGLCLALARNLKSNLGCGRKFVKPMIFTGGVAANIGVVRAIEQAFELEKGELIVPGSHFFTGAIGAVLNAKEKEEKTAVLDIEKIGTYLASHRGVDSAARRPALDVPSYSAPESRVHEDLLDGLCSAVDAYIGVDVGSISTNVVVMDKAKRVLSKAYIMTAGRPLEAVRQGLDLVGKKVAGKVNILGAASTGSGRYLTGDFIGADVVINEITAQAAGAAIVNPQVDTIFEIGGQDSKYISLQNGVVVDFEMNHACAAGTGSFLEEQAQRLGISINKEFAALAFKSKAPLKLGERCTVFMESDLLNHQQQGASTEDLVAGLAYSVAGNYLNRVVGRRKIGDNICFQGGTAFNHAVWSAFEKITGKRILVPDHHEVTGALGAASIAAEYMNKLNGEKEESQGSKFRGFENLVNLNYSVESFTCEHCSNDCEIKKVELPGSEPLYYGSRCDRYNLKKKSRKNIKFDAFAYRDKKLMEYSGLAKREVSGEDLKDKANSDKLHGSLSEEASGKSQKLSSDKIKIGIPKALITWQLLPLFSQFFKSLGFDVVLSGKTSKSVIRKGVESVTAQPCFPVKVAYGHVAELIEKGVDYIFLPSVVSMTNNYPDNKHNQLCPYVQSIPYQVKSAFMDQLGETKLLSVPIRLGEGEKLMHKSFAAIGDELNIGHRSVRKALDAACKAQKAFDEDIKEKGREILANVKPDEKLFVLISRPYNGCDAGLSLELPKKLAELGIEIIPIDMLDLANVVVDDAELHRDVYWSYGQKILRAGELIKKDNRLFAVYLSNFSCGPDSFLQPFFKDIMAEKPCLQLELDEHSADAGVITRLEAYLESLKHYKYSSEKHVTRLSVQPSKLKISAGRTLYIPYMGDSAYGVAAAFRGYRQNAEVIPIADEAALLRGRQFTTGKECLPCAITVGEMLKLIDSKGFDPAKAAFFMPSGTGPCRFGMYNCMQRLILKHAGSSDVPVIAPNQDNGFYKEFTSGVRGASVGDFMKHVWGGAVGITLLHKIILRIKPFAKDGQYAQKVYDKSLAEWVRAIENRCSLNELCKVMDMVAEDFKTIELDHGIKKPRIGIVGEIYVRSHPFANNNIISRLEELGAVCDLASLAEWIYYTNLVRAEKSKRHGKYKNYFVNKTMDHVQHKIERRLAEPLEARFGKIAEGGVEHVMELAKPYIHRSFDGEAILSVGKIIEYYHQGMGGVVNVMPFSCMPSTIVSTQTMRLSAACGDMPILNLSFDGQEDSVLPTRLEAFVSQVKQRQEKLITAMYNA